MADTKWRPNAIAVKQVTTITVGGTWADADTLTLTCNGNDLIITLSGVETTAQIAAMLSAAINAADATTGIVDDESRNRGGGEIPEFGDFVASVAGSVVTLTSRTAGVDFEVSVSETSSSGTLTLDTPTDATGPEWFDNADNWSGGLPTGSDRVVYDSNVGPCTRGLTYLRDNMLEADFLRTTDFLQDIGLPPVNASGGYKEYRQRGLQTYDTGGNTTWEFRGGDNGGAGGVTRIDNASQNIDTLLVDDAGQRPSAGGHNVEIWDGEVTTAISCIRGALILDPDSAPSSGLVPASALTVGGDGLPDEETLLTVGRNVDLSTMGSCTTKIASGRTVFRVTTYYDGSNKFNITQHGGEVEVDADGNMQAIIVAGGTFVWSGAGTQQGTFAVYTGATLDVGRDARTKTFSTINAYGGSTIIIGSHNPTITPIGCSIDDVTVIRS